MIIKRLTGERLRIRVAAKNVHMTSAASIPEKRDAETRCDMLPVIVLPARRWCRSTPCWVFPDVLVDFLENVDGGVTPVQARAYQELVPVFGP